MSGILLSKVSNPYFPCLSVITVVVVLLCSTNKKNNLVTYEVDRCVYYLHLCNVSFFLDTVDGCFVSTILMQIYGIQILQSKHMQTYVSCFLRMVDKHVKEYGSL